MLTILTVWSVRQSASKAGKGVRREHAFFAEAHPVEWFWLARRQTGAVPHAVGLLCAIAYVQPPKCDSKFWRYSPPSSDKEIIQFAIDVRSERARD